MGDKVFTHLNLLGRRVEDKVTGLRGVVTTVSFDLYGCIQVVIHPGLDDAGKEREQRWLDVCRLSLLDEPRAMDPPDFADERRFLEGKKGPAEKPAFA